MKIKRAHVQLGIFTALAAVLTINPGLPQGGPSFSNRGTQPGGLRIKINRRPKIAFRAFEMVDPKTGKKVSASTIIEIPNLKELKTERLAPTWKSRMTAGEYYGKLNSLERQFNDLGFSLRSPADEEVVQESIVDKPRLRRTSDDIKGRHLRFNAATMAPIRTATDFAAGGKATRRLSLADVGRLGKTSSDNSLSKSWNLTMGEPDSVSAYLRGKFDATGSKTTANINAEMSIGGSILNRPAEVCKVQGKFIAPLNANLTGNFDLLLFGKNVFSKAINQGLGYTWAPTNLYPKMAFRERIGEKIRFSLGPIPMSGEVGAFGEVGAKWTVLFQPLRVAANVNPYAFVGVYAEIGPDIEVCSAGVGCDLTLVRDDILLDGECYVENITEAQPQLVLRLAGTNEMEMLAGEFYVYVRYWVPFKKKKKRWTIFDWDGLKVNGVLFNELEKTINLN